jgi:hypothetical protein
MKQIFANVGEYPIQLLKRPTLICWLKPIREIFLDITSKPMKMHWPQALAHPSILFSALALRFTHTENSDLMGMIASG